MAVVLLILDGIADRPWPVLGDRTPLEAADTPNLDHFASLGQTGLLHPLGRGMAPGSEIAHFVLFGYPVDAYPGRAVFEALGEGMELTGDEVVFRGLFSTVERCSDGSLLVLERRTEVPDDECAEMTKAITPFEHAGIAIEFTYNSQHQGIVSLRSAHGQGAAPSEHVTDSDPYVAGRTVTKVEPLHAATKPHDARDTSAALNAWLAHVYRTLDAHPVNERRRQRGDAPANFLLVKWSARWRPLPDFHSLSGFRGASVSSGVTYKGIAAALGLDWYGVEYLPDWTDDLRMRLGVAARAIAEGHDYIHVHTKAPDVAGHTKDPERKRAVLEALDRAIPALWDEGLVAPGNLVIVTGDHGTPSGTELVHSGDAVPFAMLGP
ncbi:MAG: alkaline phosphatase family protein, partial [Coriobacteriia bacterium]|nr:alkaline phosphatase family protein [Coriobacteriia bacterium]